MLESITKMLTDPKESWWVVNGALMALKFAPANETQTRLPLATSEYHTMPRGWMLQHLNAALQQKKPESDAGKLILAALRKGWTQARSSLVTVPPRALITSWQP